MSLPYILPITTVQPSFQEVISDVKSGQAPFDTFWVSCYKETAPSVHEKIKVTLDDIDRDAINLEPKDGSLSISHHDAQDLYTIQCVSLNVPPTPLFCPRKEYMTLDNNPKLPQHITAFDVSPDGTQFAVGFLSGTVQIHPTTSSSTQPEVSRITVARPHHSSLTSLRFFPSSRVLLTAGADFTLTILPAEPVPTSSSLNSSVSKTISPVRTLKGHTQSIVSSAIIARGRNVLSCAKDGTIRLWDVSTSTQISVMTIGGMGKFTPGASMSVGDQGEWNFAKNSLNGSGIGHQGHHLGRTAEQKFDEREVDTAGKTVVCGLQDGSFEVFDLGSKQSVYHSSLRPNARRSALTAINYAPMQSLLVTGSSDGVVTVYDTRSLSEPLLSFARNSASIEDVMFMSPNGPLSSTLGESNLSGGVAIATADGLPYIASIKPGEPRVLGELVGSDCDGIRAVRESTDGDLWAAGDDGIVRKY
ncbi:hypothetical protein SERLA73DRAFT_71954 [Serpula lacrymans var. lacrymans S7.3]|uniref:WD40 repeat-like protein n=2 Tax=Serpula lacrymans var. lacrymans TaxID=341189 RepID=F8PTG0_SERL3|nr:uncharacterized protein SERLADRAFT_463852 [Serpula lacrymans var. lacrymans S7.9]EGO00988.1 hypothetical protein SERLA73DRAFT_71954 [Serpula lacrymans var. lacrymans S7.3]EGO26621.1 hypothetical protein SERLADRAFT_463852 [Serpula lacrymans var. lacrymans S7.9]